MPRSDRLIACPIWRRDGPAVGGTTDGSSVPVPRTGLRLRDRDLGPGRRQSADRSIDRQENAEARDPQTTRLTLEHSLIYGNYLAR